MTTIAKLVVVLGLVLGSLAPAATATAGAADPDWVFYTKDRTHYRSPWYARAHRVMIPFGCTRAPYYSPDPRCAKKRGFHHGLDIAMPCGTRLFSGRFAWVVSNDALGTAYGANPIRLRNFDQRWDLVIGHTRKVFVEPGDRIKPGMKIARASDDGAPDGCHLHFEKRAFNGGLSTATKPRRMLELKARTR